MSPVIRLIALLGVGMEGLLACSSDISTLSEVKASELTGTGAVSVGSTESDFSRLLWGQKLRLSPGPQGSFHMLLQIWAYGMSSTLLDVEVSTLWVGKPNTIVRRNPLIRGTFGVDEQGEPVLVLPLWPIPVYEPRCASGQEVAIDISIEELDADGLPADAATFQTSVMVTVELAEQYQTISCD